MVERFSELAPIEFARGVLVVGATGHRLDKLAPERRAPTHARVREALAGLAQAARAARLQDVVLASSLAEGVDRIASSAALDLGWGIAAIIPYALERFEQDFTSPQSVQEFRALLAYADPARVLDGAGIEAQHGASMGYAAAGAMLARAASVVVAVWNGEPPRGPGGTADVAWRAIADGAPVIWLHSDHDAPAQLILPERGVDPVGARVAQALNLPSIAPPPELRPG